MLFALDSEFMGWIGTGKIFNEFLMEYFSINSAENLISFSASNHNLINNKKLNFN